MDRNKFWEIIQLVHEKSKGDMDDKCELIKTSISELEVSDALEFLKLFDEMMDSLYSWSLWGAAYVMNGGCGDDSFMDFRSCIISRGLQDYTLAVEAPDELAGLDYHEETWFYEGFSYAINDAVESKIGELPQKARLYAEQPSGDEWEESPEILSNLYPKLWAKFDDIWSIPEPQVAEKPWWKFW